MEIKKRELDEAMTKIYDECGQLRSKFHKQEEEKCSPTEWKHEDGDSYLRREAYERVKKNTDDYYVRLLDERTVRVPKGMINVKDDPSMLDKAFGTNEERDTHIAIMKEMFDKYVKSKYPLKKFDESNVIGKEIGRAHV